MGAADARSAGDVRRGGGGSMKPRNKAAARAYDNVDEKRGEAGNRSNDSLRVWYRYWKRFASKANRREFRNA